MLYKYTWTLLLLPTVSKQALLNKWHASHMFVQRFEPCAWISWLLNSWKPVLVPPCLTASLFHYGNVVNLNSSYSDSSPLIFPFPYLNRTCHTRRHPVFLICSKWSLTIHAIAALLRANQRIVQRRQHIILGFSGHDIENLSIKSISQMKLHTRQFYSQLRQQGWQTFWWPEESFLHLQVTQNHYREKQEKAASLCIRFPLQPLGGSYSTYSSYILDRN